MRYVAVDIETTGLDARRDEILHFAAVIEDTDKPRVEVDDLPSFERIVRADRLAGDPYALALNHDLICAIRDEIDGHTSYRGRLVAVADRGLDWWNPFVAWVADWVGGDVVRMRSTRVPVAGKNAAGFDVPFVANQIDPYDPVVRPRDLFHHRVIDPGSVAMGARPGLWQQLTVLPSLADVVDGDVTHDALDDARDVVRALRALGARS